MPVPLLAAAVGCRNWLFADTSRGAKASATIYSLIETAKVNELEPYDYLHPVLKHIAAPTPLRRSKRCCRGTCRGNKRKKAESLAKLKYSLMASTKKHIFSGGLAAGALRNEPSEIIVPGCGLR